MTERKCPECGSPVKVRRDVLWWIKECTDKKNCGWFEMTSWRPEDEGRKTESDRTGK
jgi:hypothetical protein